jgi:hypothetical protein
MILTNRLNIGSAMTFNKKSFIATVLLALISINAYAAKSTFNEEEFLTKFNGKSNKVILEKLGAPDKKEQSVKPTNANVMIAGKGKESSKRVNVEMWYYNSRVSYAPNKTYKFTELTFVNGRCMNIAFFNNK